MIKKNCLLLISFLPLLIKAQVIFVDKTDSNYSIKEQTLSEKGKTCYALNCIKKGYIIFENEGFKPLVLVKIFDYENKGKTRIRQKPSNFTSIEDYIQGTVVPKLSADAQLRIETMASVYQGVNINLFDSIVLYDGKNYHLMQGVIETNFYNLLDFSQKDVAQSNQTTINTKAKKVTISGWGKDSIPILDVEPVDLFPKLYLIKKEKDNYTFYFFPYPNADSPLSFYREFVYKKDCDIIAFKSKYLYRVKGYIPPNVLLASDEYYYFR